MSHFCSKIRNFLVISYSKFSVILRLKTISTFFFSVMEYNVSVGISKWPSGKSSTILILFPMWLWTLLTFHHCCSTLLWINHSLVQSGEALIWRLNWFTQPPLFCLQSCPIQLWIHLRYNLMLLEVQIFQLQDSGYGFYFCPSSISSMISYFVHQWTVLSIISNFVHIYQFRPSFPISSIIPLLSVVSNLSVFSNDVQFCPTTINFQFVNFLSTFYNSPRKS